MKFVKSFLLIASVFILQSCQQYDYQSWQDIPQLRWERNNIIKNEVEISSTEQAYEMSLGLRYILELPFEVITLGVEWTSPSGKSTQKSYEIQVLDEEGNHRGDALAELVDLIDLVEADLRFEEVGKYTCKVSHQMAEPTLGGVLEVGLMLNKKE